MNEQGPYQPDNNGGDWGGQQNAAAQNLDTRPPGERGHGFADGIGGAEESTSLIPDIQINAKLFFSRIRGPILKVFIGVSALTLLIAALKFFTSVAIGLLELGPMAYKVSGVGFQLLLSVLALFTGAIQAALYRPARNALMLTDTPAPTTMGEALSQAKPAIAIALILSFLVGLVVSLGAGCCGIPGIIAFILLWPARYLVVARGMDMTSGINASMDIGKKYWLIFVLMLAAVSALLIVMGIGLGIVTGIGTAINVALYSAAIPLPAIIIGSATITAVIDVVSWVLGLLFGIGFWTIEAGVMSAIETREYGEEIALG